VSETARGRALLAWYRRHARRLPWRADRDPYRVLVSEVMLQQTQASRVEPHFEHFLSRFPAVEDLAAAPLADVLAAWSGLGYNARAARLRAAARTIVAAGWPTGVDGLQSLPGVGPYTARAVAAIAFGARHAAVDTNVRRVLSRWHGAPLQGRELQQAADCAVTGDAGTWNQALMDLGATVCLPRAPRCGECPVAGWCTDPAVNTSPRRQAAFAGSSRQARGAVIEALVRAGGRLSTAELGRSTRLDDRRIGTAVAALAADGLVNRAGDGSVDIAG
jgi:A/G-specific adenine glycosylase